VAIRRIDQRKERHTLHLRGRGGAGELHADLIDVQDLPITVYDDHIEYGVEEPLVIEAGIVALIDHTRSLYARGEQAHALSNLGGNFLQESRYVWLEDRCVGVMYYQRAQAPPVA